MLTPAASAFEVGYAEVEGLALYRSIEEVHKLKPDMEIEPVEDDNLIKFYKGRLEVADGEIVVYFTGDALGKKIYKINKMGKIEISERQEFLDGAERKFGKPGDEFFPNVDTTGCDQEASVADSPVTCRVDCDFFCWGDCMGANKDRPYDDSICTEYGYSSDGKHLILRISDVAENYHADGEKHYFEYKMSLRDNELWSWNIEEFRRAKDSPAGF